MELYGADDPDVAFVDPAASSGSPTAGTKIHKIADLQISTVAAASVHADDDDSAAGLGTLSITGGGAAAAGGSGPGARLRGRRLGRRHNQHDDGDESPLDNEDADGDDDGRILHVKLEFGRTEIRFSAEDEITKDRMKTRVRFAQMQ